MRHPAPSRLLVFLVALLGAASASAQTTDWRAYPAYNEVNAIAAAPDGMWAGTKVGVFFYGIPDGEIVTYTTVDGLRGGPIGSMAFDEIRGVLWIGYEDGLLERLDPEAGTVTPFYAITRADQYPSRGVRRVRLVGETLYLATDFGVVLFDPARGEVRDTYARIGDLETGTAVNDVIETPKPDGSPGLWVATVNGLFYATPGAPDLQTPSAWTRSPGLSGEMFSLASFDGTIYVGGGPEGARDVYRRTASGAWDRVLFTNQPLADLVLRGESLFALSRFFVFEIRPGRPYLTHYPRDFVSLGSIALGPDGGVWVGDMSEGLFSLPASTADEGLVELTPDPVVPPGPATNNIADIDVAADGVLWLATAPVEASGVTGISRFEGGEWTSFLSSDAGVDIARAPFLVGTAGPDGAFYAGSDGDGLTVVSPDGSVTTYTSANSSLEGIEGDPSYQKARGVAFEDGLRWVVQTSNRPLHVFGEDGTWTSLTLPSGPGRIPTGTEFYRIAIDDFGQKWITLGDRGLAVWNTGDDPRSSADDQSLYFSGSTVSGQGLPDPDVRDVVVDLQGRVWIGTARGLAYVFSPGSAFGGNSSLVTPQWAVLADGSDWLLRDVTVNDLEVDPGGQIWVATTTGAYLINAEGNEVVREIQSQGTPLPSSEILSVAVDPASGRVFLTTPDGLFSLAGDTRGRQLDSEALVASPSPFRPAEAPEGVVVTGLRAPSSSVRVLTVSGEVVHAVEVTGGAFRWDGRDDRTGRLAASGVYLVAAAGSDGSTLYGKVAVIR